MDLKRNLSRKKREEMQRAHIRKGRELMDDVEALANYDFDQIDANADGAIDRLEWAQRSHDISRSPSSARVVSPRVEFPTSTRWG